MFTSTTTLIGDQQNIETQISYFNAATGDVMIYNTTTAASFDAYGKPINIVTTYDQFGNLIGTPETVYVTTTSEDYKDDFVTGANTYDQFTGDILDAS